jgi:hypothetical protein
MDSLPVISPNVTAPLLLIAATRRIPGSGNPKLAKEHGARTAQPKGEP